MMELAQTLVSWLGVLVAVAGAVVSGLHLGRSRWMMVLCGGFALEAAVLLFYRLGVLFMRNAILTPGSLGLVFLGAGVVGLVARATVVAGVAGLVTEMRPSAVSAAAPPEAS